MSFSSDFLDDLRQEVAKSLGARLSSRLAERGINAPPSEIEDVIDAVALDVAMDVQFEWAGQQIYVQQISAYLRRRIYSEFDGGNVPELVRRYRLSTKTIYDYIAAERKRESEASQLTLPGM